MPTCSSKHFAESRINARQEPDIAGSLSLDSELLVMTPPNTDAHAKKKIDVTREYEAMKTRHFAILKMKSCAGAEL